MSIRVVTRNGALTITGTVRPAGAKAGVRVRRRAGTDDPRLAAEEAAALEATILRDYHLGERPAARSFAAAVTAYLQHEQRSDGTLTLVKRLLTHFREEPLDRIGQEAADRACRVLCRPDAAPATVIRNVLAPLSAILTHAARRGWCARPTFQAPRVPKARTPYLTPAQFVALHDAAAPHLRPLLTALVCTGMRLGETLALDWSAVDLRGARIRLEADTTKGGRVRVAAMPPAAVAALAGLSHREGAVFRRRGKKRPSGQQMPGLPYRETGSSGGGQIKKAWATACARAGLDGITPHALRHTFATWHYAIHRDLMKLRDEVGWSTITLAERYAKLMPDGHEDGIRRVWGLVAADTRRTQEKRA